MSDTMRKLRFFSITDYEKEAAWLSEMHSEGWQFTRLSGLGMYHFRRCEPEEVVYQLDYSQEGMKNKEEYLQLFRDCGWEYLQDYFGYSYFRKPAAEMTGEEGIFSDDASRLDMLRRVFRGQLVGMVVIFFAILIPQLIIHIRRFGPGSPYTLFWWAILGGYLGSFFAFARKYWGLRRTVEQ